MKPAIKKYIKDNEKVIKPYNLKIVSAYKFAFMWVAIILLVSALLYLVSIDKFAPKTYINNTKLFVCGFKSEKEILEKIK